MKQDSQGIKQNNYKIGDMQSVFVTTTSRLSTNSCKTLFFASSKKGRYEN